MMLANTKQRTAVTAIFKKNKSKDVSIKKNENTGSIASPKPIHNPMKPIGNRYLNSLLYCIIVPAKYPIALKQRQYNAVAIIPITTSESV